MRRRRRDETEAVRRSRTAAPPRRGAGVEACESITFAPETPTVVLPTYEQPHASHLPDELVTAVLADTVGDRRLRDPVSVVRHGEFSNDMAVATLSTGRRLIIKRGRHPWSAERFANARRAAALFRSGADIITPESLSLPRNLQELPIEVYWRIELPTLAEAWPELSATRRREAVASLGALMRRAHRVAADEDEIRQSWGASGRDPDPLMTDLTQRLYSAVAGEWPGALDLLDTLIETAPRIMARAHDERAMLHGDLHLGNVLCEVEESAVRCVGLLDLEWVHPGHAESDIARFSVMHGATFDMPLDDCCVDWLREGYGRPLDASLVNFYAVYHLINLGLYSAVIGDAWHADAVASTARALVAIA